MKKEYKPFPLYEFAGTEREIGRQMGEEMRDQIKTVIPYWYDVLGLMYNESLAEMIQVCKKFEAPAKAYAPELWDQIVGISEGSGLSTDEILFIQGGWEMDSCSPAAYGGCTDFACSGKATKDGKTIVGQNFDWYPNAPTIVIRVKPKNGPSYLAVTWPGHLAQVGINENGLGLFINLLITQGVKVGVPYAFICNKILTQKNVPDAIRAVTQAGAASNFDYTIAGKDGEIVNVEAAPGKCGIVLPDRDILAHSNHYLTHYLQRDCMNDQTSFPDSWLREYRMRQLMEDKRGELSVDVMKEILQDHRGYPDSICRHLDMTGPVEERFETVFSCIAVPEDGKLYSCPNPCENPYTLYKL